MKEKIKELLQEQVDMEREKKKFIFFCQSLFKMKYDIKFRKTGDYVEDAGSAVIYNIKLNWDSTLIVYVKLEQPFQNNVLYEFGAIKQTIKNALKIAGYSEFAIDVVARHIPPSLYIDFTDRRMFIVDREGNTAGNFDKVVHRLSRKYER